ncbi:phage terminase large subunit [Shouchella patagoniensis]|uniref:phage terminase large subunit n=1 Tax=Shouchella patagoniensis TaxID=228576 RepID=UPI0009950B0E|nr:phage terminase large subunit [Shouchella patagoniensis]
MPANELDDESALELASYIDEKERLERIHRAEVDLLYFVHEYFSEVRNPENSGNWDGFDIESPEEAAEFHREICAIIDEVSNVKTNDKVAVAAPRGHGKSSYLSKGGPLRDVVFRKRKYIIMISETDTVAKANLDWLTGQLKYNKKLREDFGDILSPKQQLNVRDNGESFITWESGVNSEEKKLLTLVETSSTNKSLRGRNWNGTRPDMIICDDLEDIRSNASTPEQRAKLKDWFSQTVIPLGDPKGKKTAFVYMGTIVHAESNLNNVIKHHPDFKSRLFKALIDDPDRVDLWEQCRAIFVDAETPKEERAVKALDFYKTNRKEMDKGAKVLWPEVQPLWKLMKWKWTEGSKAFNTEYQNTPLDEDSQIFVPAKFALFSEADLIREDGRPLNLSYYAFWDIATGRSSRSDYNAIVTVARNNRTGVIYTIDAWAKRCSSHEALRMAVEKIRVYEHRIFAVETIGAGHDMHRQLRERLSQEGLLSRTRLKPISHHSAKKEKRIESLEPLTENGFLRFMGSQRLLFEQLEQFPTGTYDDLPDALAGAVDLSGGARRSRRTSARKPGNL